MYKRIPKNIIKRSDERVSYENGKIMNEEMYKQTKVESYLREMNEKIKKKEEETLKEITENKEKILQQSYEEGYGNGKETALNEALEIVRSEQAIQIEKVNEEYEKANRHLKQILDETDNFKEHYLKEKKDEILELSIEIARKIIGREIEINSEAIQSIYNQSKAQIEYESKKIFVRMHPDSEKALFENELLKIDKRIEFLLDVTLKPGDFILETDRECVDATIETQLRELKSYLRGAF